MSVYKHLFAPITIGNMTAKNRLMMSAMSINFGVNAQGQVTDQLTADFTARAKGGAGLMLVGGGAVHPTGLELPDLPTLWDDNCIEPLRKMVAVVKPHDVRFGVQLMHGGRQSYHDRKVAPSPIPAAAVVKGVPRELTTTDIRELVKSFGAAARRCQAAGFDFIEVHAAHGVRFKSAGKKVQLEGFDTVAIAEAMVPVREAKNLASRTEAEFHIIGDAKKPRNLMPAISEAEELGRWL